MPNVMTALLGKNIGYPVFPPPGPARTPHMSAHGSQRALALSVFPHQEAGKDIGGRCNPPRGSLDDVLEEEEEYGDEDAPPMTSWFTGALSLS